MHTNAQDVYSAASAPRRGVLLRVLGVGFGLAVIIGNTIGAGILRTPGEVAAHLPHTLLFLGAWVLGGLYALLGAISLAELATALPLSGGQYVYARRALGDYAGFVVGWSDWLSTCGTTAAVSLVIGEYAGALFPALGGESVGVALVITIGFALLQWHGIDWGSRVQNTTSLLKALGFVALVLMCFALGGAAGREAGEAAQATTTASSQATAMASASLLLLGLMKALQAIIYTYDGWAGVVYFTEEVREPARDVPRSLFGGVLLIIGIYLLLNAALIYVVPLRSLAGSELAVGTAAQVIFGTYGETLIRILTIVSLLSGINAYHLMATRVLFAMSRDQLFWPGAARVNTGGTPALSLFISAGVAVLFILQSRTFARLIDALAFFFVANYTMSFVSVFVLRRREPDLPRPYRAWGYPLTTAAALTGSILFLLGAVASDIMGGTRNSISALVLLAASYPVFISFRWLARRKGSVAGEL